MSIKDCGLDIQQMQILLQMHDKRLISDTTFLSELGYSQDEELANLIKEMGEKEPLYVRYRPSEEDSE